MADTTQTQGAGTNSAAAGDGIMKAGDVIIDFASIITVKGNEVNISAQILTIDLHENLFQPFMYGSIIISESYDFVNTLPLIGQEKLRLRVRTPSLPKEQWITNTFFINNVSKRDPTANTTVMYELEIISSEMIMDKNIKLSMGFEGKISDIAKKIIKDVGLRTEKKITVEDTPFSTKYVSNFWSPLKNLIYICETSANSNNSPTYIFFENRNGFNFVSLDYLYSQTPSAFFEKTNKVQGYDKNLNMPVKDLDNEYSKIIDYTIHDGFDYMARAKKGMYSSNLITVDPVSKQISFLIRTLNQDWDKRNHLNTYSPLGDNSLHIDTQAITYMTKSYASMNNYVDVTNASVVLERNAMMGMAEANILYIKVMGRTDYTCGLRVYVQLPASKPVAADDQNVVDVLNSGFYLISNVRHIIHSRKHIVELKLIKDSMIENVNTINEQKKETPK